MWGHTTFGAWWGNLDPTGPQLQAGWVPILRYTSLGGATHTSSVTEVVEWVQTQAPPDGSGKPLSFSSAIRGPHGKEWTLADEQELITLLVTLK